MFKSGTFISFLIALFGCVSCSEQVDLPTVSVLGHGGGGFTAIQNPHPANSRNSIERAIFLEGADGVEVDIQVTADNKFVLYHDNRLETSTNSSGFISDYTLSDLQSVSYRGGTDQSTKYPLLSLDEAIQILSDAGRNLTLSLNIQPQPEIEDQESYRFTIKLMLRSLRFKNTINMLVESPDRELLKALTSSQPWPPFISYYYDASASATNVEFAKDLQLKGLVSNYLNEDQSSVQTAKEAGLEMVLYGLKIRKDIVNALKLEPDMIQTDNVPLSLDILGR